MVKTKDTKIECCADVISFLNGKLVVVERLSEPKGLALVGGRLDPDESLEQCAIREFKEETGLDLKIDFQFRTYSDPNRDPRGQKVSTVFVGKATGNIRNEDGKTIVKLVDLKDFNKFKNKFVFDHTIILQDFLDHTNKFKNNKLTDLKWKN